MSASGRPDVPTSEYECVYCGQACTKRGHVDPSRDAHRVMAVPATWAIYSDLKTTRLLKRLMENEVPEPEPVTAARMGEGNRTSLRYEHRGGGVGTFRPVARDR